MSVAVGYRGLFVAKTKKVHRSNVGDRAKIISRGMIIATGRP
jgi:hypothetical protein